MSRLRPSPREKTASRRVTNVSLFRSQAGRIGGDRRGGRSPADDELVALRLGHGVRGGGRPDARIPGGRHGLLHSSR